MNFPLTIDSKRKFTLPDGTEIVDLTQQTLEYEYEDVIVYNSFYCTSQMNMRADKIAQIVYSDKNKTEYILKFNNISNPFSIEEGDLISIPESLNAREHFKIKGEIEEIRENLRKQFIDESKLIYKDEKLTEFDKRQTVNLPPNFSKESDKAITIKNGEIIFGENISKTKNEDEETDNITLDKKRFISKIKTIKERKHNETRRNN